jgi:hypothetical protein
VATGARGWKKEFEAKPRQRTFDIYVILDQSTHLVTTSPLLALSCVHEYSMSVFKLGLTRIRLICSRKFFSFYDIMYLQICWGLSPSVSVHSNAGHLCGPVLAGMPAPGLHAAHRPPISPQERKAA